MGQGGMDGQRREGEGPQGVEEYRQLVDAVGDGIYQLDAEGRFVAVNEVFTALAGYDREELLGSDLSLVLDDPDVARIDAMVHTMRSHDLPGTPVDVPIETRTGDVIPCELRVSIYQEDGEFAGTVGVLRDVSERTGLDPNVAAVTGRYESLVKDVLDGAAVGVAVVDADERLTWVNEAMETYFGLDRAEIIGRDAATVFDRCARDAVADPARFLGAHEGTPAEDAGSEFQIVPGEGRTHRWLLHRANPIETGRYAGGRVDLYYDVTERKQSEQVARDREQRLHEEQAFTESLLDAQPDVVYAVDTQGRPLRWNDRVPEVTGYSDAEIAWMEAPEFVAEDARYRAAEAFAEVLETGEPTTVELPLLTAEGEEIPYQFSGSPLTDDGEIVGLTGVGRDISRLEAQARRLERQRDELEAELQEVFDRVDDAFVALDEAFRFTYVNDRAESLLAGDASDLLSASVAADPNLTPAIVESIETAFAEQRQVTVQDRLPDGETWIECHVYPSATGVSVYFRDVSERERRKRELEHQRERLAALDDLNAVVRGITDAVLDQSTRPQIERAVLDGLVRSDSYAAAWIGEADPGGEAIRQRQAAGFGEAPGEGDQPVDGDRARPASLAVRRRTLQVCRDCDDGCPPPPLSRGEEAPPLRAAAAIPIAHDETLYGVLTVYTARDSAFSAEEREVIGQVGEITGHAIAAVERKRALTSDEVVEVDFAIEEVFPDVDGVGEPDGITFDQTVPVGDGRYHVYGTATADGMATLAAYADEAAHVVGLRTISAEGDLSAFELRQTEPPLSTALATHGGRIDTAVVDDGTYSLTVQFPPGVAVRTIREVVTEAYPDATLLAQRQVSRPSDSPARVLTALESELTDRQRVVLQAAYFGGYFEWPRASTGEEIAESLDIAPATFSQHLRTAQARLFGVLLDDDSPIFD